MKKVLSWIMIWMAASTSIFSTLKLKDGGAAGISIFLCVSAIERRWVVYNDDEGGEVGDGDNEGGEVVDGNDEGGEAGESGGKRRPTKPG